MMIRDLSLKKNAISLRDGPKFSLTHRIDKIGYHHLVIYGVLTSRTPYVVTDGLANFGV